MSEQRTAVITGSNSGFGRLTAEQLVADGWRVFATMRKTATTNAGAARQLRDLGAHVVELDVTNDASVDAAAKTILATATPDVLVNNAGAAYFGILESFTPALAEQQYAINVFGPLRVNRAFLPAMRERGTGLIVYVSSVVGRLTMPLGGLYASTKWALEALAESSWYELAPLGIDVAIVQPGAFPTEISAKRSDPDDPARAAGYGQSAQRFTEGIFGSLGAAAQGRDPGDVAREIVRLANLPSGSRPLRVAVPSESGVETLNATAAAVQAAMFEGMGIGDLYPKSGKTPVETLR
jgi:NAD(P)-dependent dehydrogenase (short-subunit alcohol dehydrogenase family)